MKCTQLLTLNCNTRRIRLSTTSTHTASVVNERGSCDHSTGECKRFPSFTGEGCRRTTCPNDYSVVIDSATHRRTTCPNDCSGHGQCRTDANPFFYLGQTPTAPFGDEIPEYSRVVGVSTWGIHWPWLEYQQCHCDAGYEGDDCSLRQCPRGDDPETDCQTDRGKDQQKLDCAFQGAVKTGFFQLRFTDQFGGEYDTRPIKIDSDAMSSDESADSIQDALEALSNFAHLVARPLRRAPNLLCGHPLYAAV